MNRIALSVAALATAAGTVMATSAPAGAAHADQRGLVNVAIGDVSILNDVNIGVAANVIANVCGLKVGPVAVLATAVDRSGAATTVCEGATGPVTILQD